MSLIVDDGVPFKHNALAATETVICNNLHAIMYLFRNTYIHCMIFKRRCRLEIHDTNSRIHPLTIYEQLIYTRPQHCPTK